MKLAFPQFAQEGPHGENTQQDAEECLSQLLNAAATHLKTSGSGAAPAAAAGGASHGDNIVDQLFSFDLEEKYVHALFFSYFCPGCLCCYLLFSLCACV
jgi:hypothetical protein